MKSLECSGDQPQLPTLYGGEPVAHSARHAGGIYSTCAGSTGEQRESSAAEPAPDGRLEALDTLTTSLAQHGLMEGVTRIEFADTEQLAFLYQGRISVLLGTLNELEYKLDFAAYLLHNTDGKGCAETDTGQLDCSHVRGRHHPSHSGAGGAGAAFGLCSSAACCPGTGPGDCPG